LKRLYNAGLGAKAVNMVFVLYEDESTPVRLTKSLKKALKNKFFFDTLRQFF